MMQGPHFEHLTNNYVEALGLESFLYKHDEPIYADIEIGPGIKVLDMRFTGYDLAVVYNHGLYLRHPDGLSWELKR